MKKIVTWIGAGFLSLLPAAAWADTCTGTTSSCSFNITAANSAISPTYTGPYATVTVTLTSSTTATITFTSLTNGSGNIYLMGDGGSVAVNVNATSSTITNITGSNSGTNFTQQVPNGKQQFTSAGAGQLDGAGNFNQSVDSFDGYTHTSTTISFTVTGGAGTDWTNANQVLVANANGALAGIHIFVADCTGSPCVADGNAATGALATGFGNNGLIVTPLPSALVLFGSVLFGGLGVGRWRRHYRRGPVSVMGSPAPVMA
jgi:hypothetical protein